MNLLKFLSNSIKRDRDRYQPHLLICIYQGIPSLSCNIQTRIHLQLGWDIYISLKNCKICFCFIGCPIYLESAGMRCKHTNKIMTTSLSFAVCPEPIAAPEILTLAVRKVVISVTKLKCSSCEEQHQSYNHKLAAPPDTWEQSAYLLSDQRPLYGSNLICERQYQLYNPILHAAGQTNQN